jgi:hypothetical protein
MAGRCYYGRHTGGGYGWVVYTQTVSKLVLCHVCVGMLQRQRADDRIFLIVANAYRGELLGLMAIHLILLSINKIHCNLTGGMEIVSDCLGTLKRVPSVPPYRIPSCCRHSDILKNLLVNCQNLSFTVYYSHMKAHQDNTKSFKELNRKAQLNCICNHTAKQQIAINVMNDSTPGWMSPIEPIGLFIKGEKMTSETGDQLWFWAHL